MRRYHNLGGGTGPVREAWGRLVYRTPPSPHRIQFEVTNRCNLDCPMCPREIYELPQHDLPLERMRAILADLPDGVRRIILTGWGEPLLHPRFFDLVALAKGTGREVQATTNGMLLAEPMRRRLLDSGVDYLNFSVETTRPQPGQWGHDNALALDRIAALACEARGGIPFLSVQATMHPGGLDDLLSVVRWTGETGIPRVSLIRLNLRDVPGLKRPSWDQEREMVAAAEREGKRYGLEVEHNNAFGRGWVRGLYRAVRPHLYRGDRFCGMPYDTLYVTVEGKVTPCCSLPKHFVGDTADASLQSIWSGERMADFQRNQGTVCGDCDILKSRPFPHLEPTHGDGP